MKYTFSAIIISVIILIANSVSAQDITHVSLDLQQNEKGRLLVKVAPPENLSDQWSYVIPQIIPGTYMKINYRRFYHKIAAFDNNGNPLKYKRKDNVISGKKGSNQPLGYLTFEVEQSLYDGRIWDNILGCAGTIFTDSSFLLNWQLITGYFEGYQDKPFEITLNKSPKLYGAGAAPIIRRGAEQDVIKATSYDELIDAPMLYAPADTTSITIKGYQFKVGVHAENGHVSAQKMRPALERILHAVDSFSGFTNKEPYHLLFYHLNPDRVKGIFGPWGIGSALEHNHSSVYFFSDSPYYDSAFRNLDHIVTHEYFHTIAPLSLHSEKIENFNFKHPDMSKHLWLYEGVTDYFSALLNSQYELSNPLGSGVAWAIHYGEKRKLRSMTESSANIIKSNMFNWIGKIIQLTNFYEKGKLLAFGIDMELAKRSNGEKRLLDVMLQMREDYIDKPFPEDQFIDLLTKYTYPDMKDYYIRHIEGKELVPYEKYLGWLGWEYQPVGSEKPAYASKLDVRYDKDNDQYNIRKVSKNQLGLKKDDVILTINGIESNLKNAREGQTITKLLSPKKDDQITLEVMRAGKTITLNGTPDEIGHSFMANVKLVDNPTKEQNEFSEIFLGK